MKLSLSRKYDANADEMRRRLCAMQARLRSNYGARTEWVDDSTLSIGAPGVRGRVELMRGEVAVRLEVSAMLRPLRGRIEQQLGRELDRVTEPQP